MKYYLALKKERNPAICDNMDGPWGHYAKWNKSDTEGQLLPDKMCMRDLNVKPTDAESGMMVARVWG